MPERDPDAPLLTPERESVFEAERILGSRFVAWIAPAADEAEAQALVERARAEHPGATHHCFAWRLGARGERHRANDDGEPAGSAGRPILAQLEGHATSQLCCVVVRWFGGTKLGVGGLMRAYGGTAGMALDRTPLVPLIVRRRVQLAFPYECAGVVEGLLKHWRLEPMYARYAEAVRLRVDVPEADLVRFEAELRERTAARARLDDDAGA